jgi:hypothetical protein
LYRLVKLAHKELKDGEWKPSTSAFLGGSAHRVSVYRAALVANDPSSLPAEEPGYICRFVTEQVRAISIERDNPEGGDPEIYEVRVKATPQYHEAHADIYTHPPAPNNSAKKTVFRFLKEELADLAQWEPGFAPSDREEG